MRLPAQQLVPSEHSCRAAHQHQGGAAQRADAGPGGQREQADATQADADQACEHLLSAELLQLEFGPRGDQPGPHRDRVAAQPGHGPLQPDGCRFQQGRRRGEGRPRAPGRQVDAEVGGAPRVQGVPAAERQAQQDQPDTHRGSESQHRTEPRQAAQTAGHRSTRASAGSLATRSISQ